METEGPGRVQRHGQYPINDVESDGVEELGSVSIPVSRPDDLAALRRDVERARVVVLQAVAVGEAIEPHVHSIQHRLASQELGATGQCRRGDHAYPQRPARVFTRATQLRKCDLRAQAIAKNRIRGHRQRATEGVGSGTQPRPPSTLRATNSREYSRP